VNSSIQQALDRLHPTLDALQDQAASIWLPIQACLILIAALAALAVARVLRRQPGLAALAGRLPAALRPLFVAIIANLDLIVFVITAGLLRVAMLNALPPSQSYLVSVSINLALAWVVISVLTALIQNHLVNRLVAIIAWTIATLSILGLLDSTTGWLDRAAIVVGGLRLSVWLVLKASVLLLLALWAAAAASNLVERMMRGSADLTLSMQVLIGKLIRITLVALAIIIVLGSVGIDLSALALFSGAIGLGVGFGLQKIVSNLVSGIILLADKSIKPGDVISVGDSFGWVDMMGARYTSVVQRDGREVLIPNEDLVTHQVLNWSHTSPRVRLEVRFGVSYASDPHAVAALAVREARRVDRVMPQPEPACFLRDFGESSLDFVLRFWIDDPAHGVANVRGAMLMALWDAFKREGVEIPNPARDVRLVDPARVVLERTEERLARRA
jgi:small-conductance mechanosensitive channel